MPTPRTRLAVVLPIRGFEGSKTRLQHRLGPTARADLVRRLADGVLDAAGDATVYVVTDDAGVRDWAARRAVRVVSSPPGLDAAAAAGAAAAGADGFDLVAVTHADLALPHELAETLEGAAAGTIVADRVGDGTNLLVVPTATPFAFRYGPGSYPAHLAALTAAGIDPILVHNELAWDVDTPEDIDDLRAIGVDVTTHRTVDLATPRVALAVGAHPDDIEFGAGATLAKWAANGTHVVMVVCTDGSKGTWDASASTERLAATRAEEQRAAARQLSTSAEVHMLGAVDGELVDDDRLRLELGRLIRATRPDVVLGHDPWKRYRLHPDHRVAGQLVIDAIVGARDPHFFSELDLDPHRPDDLLLFEPDEADHLERVTTAHLDRKLAALESHESQFETTHFSGVDPTDALAGFRRRERRRLEDAAAPFRAALGEEFHRIDRL